MSARRLIAPALIAAVCLAGCDSMRTDPLPTLVVPADFTVAEQIDLLYFHFGAYANYVADGIDVRLDSKNHVFENAGAGILHHRSWGSRTQGYREDPDRIYAMSKRIPKASRFRGARLRAVALGLLALSLWRRDRPPRVPTLKELRRCILIVNVPGKCDYSARTLALYRFILVARHADHDLFKRLGEQQLRLLSATQTHADHDRPARTGSP